MTAAKKIRPTKWAAARMLRELSKPEHLAVADSARVGADLRLIADCILGEARWSRTGKYPPAVQMQINFFAHMVESRPRGEPVADALDKWASELVRRLGKSGPEAEQEFRDAITRARKAGRKSRQSDK